MKTDPPFFQSTTLAEATLSVRALQPMLRFYCGILGLQLVAGNQRRAELSATGRAPALLILELLGREGKSMLLSLKTRERSVPARTIASTRSRSRIV